MNLHYKINDLIPEDRISERTANLASSVSRDYLFEADMVIYKATNIINNKVYIGQTIDRLKQRISNHIYASHNCNCYYFARAIRKHGKDNFTWEIIRICKNVDELNVWEQYYILFYNSMESGYNLTSGGLNYIRAKRTKEHKKKLGNAHKGKKLSNKHKKKIGQAGIGRKHTKESRKKMSIALKGKKFTDKHKINISIAKQNMSEETKGKIRQANLGKKLSDKTKQKISKSLSGENHPNYGKRGSKMPNYGKLGKKRSTEVKLKMSVAKKEYYQKLI